MATELRKTGIDLVGDLPWGTHFCSFYETKQDLLDILIPYFKTGLANKEFCLWVISNSELLTAEEAIGALRTALPDLDRYVTESSIEVVGHEDWFLGEKTFDARTVANRFSQKLNEALARGYAGMRVNGSPAWLQDAGPKELRNFEAELDKIFPHERTIASCTYPLATIGAEEIFDVMRNHQFAIARRQGKWEVFETPELIQTKAQIKRLNEQLEQRVIERTNELREANEDLRKEIAERKQSESQLAEAQRLAHIGSWSLDINSNSVTWSDELYRIFGVQASKFDHRYESVIRTTHPEDREWLRSVIENALKTHEPFSVYYRITKSTGELRVLHARGAVVSDEQGNAIRLHGTAQDVTERKQAEEKLKQSENQLAEAQRLAHVGSFDWNLRTNKVTWSDELYRIFGLQPGEVKVAGDALAFIHPQDRDVVMNTLQSAVKSKELYGFYYRVLRPDGDERIVHTRGQILSDEHGEPIRVFGFTQDITELERAEEDLKATNDQLRALSARLQSAREEEGTRIAREIHDELGSALTSLKWDLERIDKELSNKLEPLALVSLREKLQTAMKLADLSITAIRRIASELRPSVLDDLGLVAAIEWQAQQFQSRTGIVCVCDCSLEKVELTGQQSTAIFRILQETLTNVLRHAQATQVHIKITKEKGNFVLSVSDDGKGITKSVRAEQQSLGILGMRERAHLIGGEIDIKGIEGKGTVVTLRVPISQEDAVLKKTR